MVVSYVVVDKQFALQKKKKKIIFSYTSCHLYTYLQLKYYINMIAISISTITPPYSHHKYLSPLLPPTVHLVKKVNFDWTSVFSIIECPRIEK